jgi:hypothetical protein
MRMRKYMICVAAWLLAAGTVYSQSASALLVPGDAGTLSLGLTQRIPGDFGFLDAGISGGLWAPGSASNTYLGANVGLKLTPALTLRMDGKYFKDAPYEMTSGQGAVTGSYEPADLFFSVGGSYMVGGGLSLGIDARLISSSIAPTAKATGFCADVSASYSAETYTAMLSVRNLGPGLDYGSGASALPSLATVAGAIRPVDALKLCLEADYLFSGALMAGLGLEYCVADIAFLRAGYHYGDASKALASYASLGLGAVFSGFSVDLAYLTASETLGNSLIFGLGYSF